MAKKTIQIPAEYEREWREVEARAKAKFMDKHKPRINPHVWLLLGLLCLGWLMHREYQEERKQQAKLAKSNAIVKAVDK